MLSDSPQITTEILLLEPGDQLRSRRHLLGYAQLFALVGVDVQDEPFVYHTQSTNRQVWGLRQLYHDTGCSLSGQRSIQPYENRVGHVLAPTLVRRQPQSRLFETCRRQARCRIVTHRVCRCLIAAHQYPA